MDASLAVILNKGSGRSLFRSETLPTVPVSRPGPVADLFLPLKPLSRRQPGKIKKIKRTAISTLPRVYRGAAPNEHTEQKFIQ